MTVSGVGTVHANSVVPFNFYKENSMSWLNREMRSHGRCWADRKSERVFKKIWHRRMRGKVNVLCNQVRLRDDIDAVDFPVMNEVSDDWWTKYLC